MRECGAGRWGPRKRGTTNPDPPSRYHGAARFRPVYGTTARRARWFFDNLIGRDVTTLNRYSVTTGAAGRRRRGGFGSPMDDSRGGPDNPVPQDGRIELHARRWKTAGNIAQFSANFHCFPQITALEGPYFRDFRKFPGERAKTRIEDRRWRMAQAFGGLKDPDTTNPGGGVVPPGTA